MEPEQFEDLYEILDVDFGSSRDDIIQKYKEKLGPYQQHISHGNKLDKELKWEIKLLKIAKYVLTNDTLRKKYNLSRILQDSDESHEVKDKVIEPIESNKPPNSKLEYKELQHFDVPLRKDQPINLKELADRQFERFDHKTFDLNKDRQLRGVNNE